MEIRLLNEGYKNNENFYTSFLNNELISDKYVSDEKVIIDRIVEFPIYVAKDKESAKNENFRELIEKISDNFINIDRSIYLSEIFWHSYICLYMREYVLNKYPKINISFSSFKNIVIKKFDWENYIYKAVLISQYLEDYAEEKDRDKYIDMILDNLDLFNYIIKYEIFRNGKFLINILDIIDKYDLSKKLKAKIKGRDDLGDDERYGRRVIYEFNKSYPIVLAPMLETEELEEYFFTYLGFYTDIDEYVTK